MTRNAPQWPQASNAWMPNAPPKEQAHLVPPLTRNFWSQTVPPPNPMGGPFGQPRYQQAPGYATTNFYQQGFPAYQQGMGNTSRAPFFPAANAYPRPFPPYRQPFGQPAMAPPIRNPWINQYQPAMGNVDSLGQLGLQAPQYDIAAYKRSLDSAFTDPKGCDLRLTSHGNDYYCHYAVVASFSSVLGDLLRSIPTYPMHDFRIESAAEAGDSRSCGHFDFTNRHGSAEHLHTMLFSMYCPINGAVDSVGMVARRILTGTPGAPGTAVTDYRHLRSLEALARKYELDVILPSITQATRGMLDSLSISQLVELFVDSYHEGADVNRASYLYTNMRLDEVVVDRAVKIMQHEPSIQALSKPDSRPLAGLATLLAISTVIGLRTSRRSLRRRGILQENGMVPSDAALAADQAADALIGALAQLRIGDLARN